MSEQLVFRFHEAADLYPLLDERDLSVIVESMRRHGFDPRKPVLRYRGQILDGRNRLRAAEIAGVKPVVIDVADDCDPYMEAWKHNGARRDLEPDHKAAIFIRTLERSEAWVRERGAARETANKARSESQKGVPKAVAAERGVSRDTRGSPKKSDGYERSQIAKQAGVSAATVARVQALEKKSPAKFEAVLRGEARAHRELGDLKREERIAKLAGISAANQPLDGSVGRYPIIYADPPWRYEHVETESRAIENQYPTMALDDICSMPVPTVCTDDAVLFLWATSPKLAEAMRVVSSWGFVYRTCMVWDKEKIGMGYYARQQHELLLIATRGQPPAPPPSARPSSVVRIARGEHSAKPVEFYELIERMYPSLPKLELFCRAPRDGWRSWGNQAAA